MLKRIQGMLLGRHAAPQRGREQDMLMTAIAEAHRRMKLARAHYDALMQSVVWTPDIDTRIDLAYRERDAAEGVYTFLMGQARQAGVMATWEDVVAI